MYNKSQNTVLITGARAPIALELCRGISRHNFRVLCSDSNSFPVRKFSKYCKGYYRLPGPALDFEAWKKSIFEIVEKEKVDYVIPTGEEAFYLSKIAGMLPCKVWVSDIELMKQLHNKYHFISLAKDYFNVPETVYYKDFNDFENAKKYVFKPVYSRFGNNVLINKNYDFVKEKIHNPDNWIAQEKIEGKQICSYGVFEEGQLKAHVFYEPKYLYKGGASMLFHAIEEEEIQNRIKEFARQINYTGQLSFDFIVRDDKAYVLECNPRGTSGVHLLAENRDWFFLNNTGFTAKIRNKALKLPILFDKPSAVFDKEFNEAKDVIFNYKDIVPTFGQILSLMEIFYKKFVTSKSMADVMTYEFEYNGK